MAAVDIDAPPPDAEPVALILFGTNQAAPAQIAAERYRRGTAPLIIATGGINRHNGITEGPEFARQLTRQASRTAPSASRTSPAHLAERRAVPAPPARGPRHGAALAVVSKWYHLRTSTAWPPCSPRPSRCYAISWEPVYADTLVTRASWPKIPDGCRRVLRESQEVPRRVAEGTYRALRKADGTWQLA